MRARRVGDRGSRFAIRLSTALSCIGLRGFDCGSFGFPQIGVAVDYFANRLDCSIISEDWVSSLEVETVGDWYWELVSRH